MAPGKEGKRCNFCTSVLPDDTVQKYLNIYCTKCHQWMNADSSTFVTYKCGSCGARVEVEMGDRDLSQNKLVMNDNKNTFYHKIK